MFRRLLIPLLGSGLLLAASAGSALAKCEGSTEPKPAFCSQIIVSLNIVGGGTLLAGTSEAVDIDVSRGEQPYAAMDLWLTFTDLDGISVRVPATAASAGRWTADVLLPNVSNWSVVAQVVDLSGGEHRIPVNTVWGTTVPALPPAETPVTAPPVTPASPVLPIALLLGLLAAAAGAGLVIRDRSRRRTAGVGVAAASTASTVTADRV